jgi:hypothetical protein
MRKPGKPSSSGAIIILRQMENHEWLFTLPRITEEVDDRLEEGIDWIDADPERAASTRHPGRSGSSICVLAGPGEVLDRDAWRNRVLETEMAGSTAEESINPGCIEHYDFLTCNS